jgi:hypothetical protein
VSGLADPGRGSSGPFATARADVWLGDLIRAWRTLEVGGEEARRVAELMGFGLRAAPAAQDDAAPGPDRGTDSSENAVPAQPGAATARGPVGVGSGPRPAPAQADTRVSAQRITFRRNLRPAGVDVGLHVQPGADALDRAHLLPVEAARRTTPLPLLPLLPTWVTPGILTASIATDAGDGRPDVDALVELIAQRRFDVAIPRFVRASLFRGVQLLLDRSPAMIPFARDVTELARMVRSVVGHNVEEISFSGAPQDLLPSATKSYAPPRPGTPVLALSDLGIGQAQGYLRPDASTTWPPLAEMLHRRGSPLVALVPYPRSRRPALGDWVRMIPWDTTTSPADVTRAVGRVLGGPRGRR